MKLKLDSIQKNILQEDLYQFNIFIYRNNKFNKDFKFYYSIDLILIFRLSPEAENNFSSR